MTGNERHMDANLFRRTMGRFASGVTVVTGLVGADLVDGGTPVGVTVSAFSSVSLEPPLGLICLAKETGCLTAFTGESPFGVNILADDQDALSQAFAGPQDPAFHGYSFDRWTSGVPKLRGVAAALECRPEQVVDAGDHVIVVSRVLAATVAEDREPLLYFAGAYRRLAHLQSDTDTVAGSGEDT